ncbi:hypothetical protein Halsa_1408 [Halanaerobium hydrogeniformans]|uniref:Uncharacterized protein n=2 Tax=Halanaerobium hydrogeniformans TaxID=656519 RepID=E4RLC1_HALHG|nr:hypothetical protein Halsa_1408 [Halanaerobium hydrogeniformans]
MAAKIKKKELLLVLITILIILIAAVLFNNFKGESAEELTVVENETEVIETDIETDEQSSAEEDSTKMIASIDELQDPFFNQQIESDNDQKTAVKEEELLVFAGGEDFWYPENADQQIFSEEKEVEDLIYNRAEKIDIPFKLQGIIKDKNHSLAIFQFQNQFIEKREGEKLAGFLIKNIEAKEVMITLENFKVKLSVWGDNKVE